MKYSVIDIGSNSVRLLISENGKSILKTSKITGLAKGLSFVGYLTSDIITSVAKVVAEFYDYSIANEVDKVYAFATAGLRQAKNANDFYMIASSQLLRR